MTTGVSDLMFPQDLDQWQSWQERRRRLSRVAHRARRIAGRATDATSLMLTGPPDADVIFAFDSTNAPTVRTFIAIARALRNRGATVGVLDAGENRLRDELDSPTVPLGTLRVRPAAFVSIGHYARVGNAAWKVSRRRGGRFFVLQHGVLTPFSPPLPTGSHLLAWSMADAQYWTATRADVTCSYVGAPPLVWAREDSSTTAHSSPTSKRPLFLGQMHGAELSWPMKLASALDFCARYGADYRPHPAETSLLSRAAHRTLRAADITLTSNGLAPAATQRPLISMFSTGLLEAAAAGLDTYGFAVRPPLWLEAFWDRYQIGQWQTAPTRIDSSMVPGTSTQVIASIAREVTS